jgi:hypothetical protein
MKNLMEAYRAITKSPKRTPCGQCVRQFKFLVEFVFFYTLTKYWKVITIINLQTLISERFGARREVRYS